MRVPFADLGLKGKPCEPEVIAAVTNLLEAGSFIGGPEVDGFEGEFARFCGAREAVGVSSGTDALVFALLATGICPGDEVVTTPLSFVATAEAISHVGATPVFVDVDP
ncbi:MAG TPA: aminotransferase class I/II-fold pyridoxal phosphate-dependent enzyme, partial [Methylomirabilota bacterium]|nr:aminotransferase class I/II-fold pyridoxal phosphate-dependent enzyme [Methylomirabilota bacterium]